MICCEITPELLRTLLRYESDTGRLFWRPRPVEMFSCARIANSWNSRFAGKEAFTPINSKGYRKGCVLGVQYQAHRVCWAIETGAWPEDDIDHEDGVRSNNRFKNLRDATQVENNRNQRRRSTNTSGVVGVCRNNSTGKWRAQIRADGRQHHLGTFTNFAAAVAARKAAETEHGYHENHGRP